MTEDRKCNNIVVLLLRKMEELNMISEKLEWFIDDDETHFLKIGKNVVGRVAPNEWGVVVANCFLPVKDKNDQFWIIDATESEPTRMGIKWLEQIVLEWINDLNLNI